jgi:hypothetical protein
VEKVYTDATAAMLKQGHISLLSLCQFPKVQPNLPSWVPDWSQPVRAPIQAFENDHMTLAPRFNAAGSLRQTQTVVFKDEGRTIKSPSILGYVYDKVHEVGLTYKEIETRTKRLSSPLICAAKWLFELISLSSLHGEVDKSLENQIRATARTAAAEMGYSEKGKWERVGDERFCAAATLLMNYMDESNQQFLFEPDFLELVARERLSPRIDPKVMFETKIATYLGEICVKALGTKPFISSKGHLGLGPDRLEVGDSIAVFRGADVPFVLRQGMSEQYQLIGEAYVDGIMDGEAVVGSDISDIIELC